MPAFQNLLPEKAAEMMDAGSVQCVDIRDLQSFSSGRIRGALHLTNENVADFTLNGEFELPVLVCCYHGLSSQGAAQYLAEQGFEECYSLVGGFEAWLQLFPERVEQG